MFQVWKYLDIYRYSFFYFKICQCQVGVCLRDIGGHRSRGPANRWMGMSMAFSGLRYAYTNMSSVCYGRSTPSTSKPQHSTPTTHKMTLPTPVLMAFVAIILVSPGPIVLITMCCGWRRRRRSTQYEVISSLGVKERLSSTLPALRPFGKPESPGLYLPPGPHRSLVQPSSYTPQVQPPPPTLRGNGSRMPAQRPSVASSTGTGVPNMGPLVSDRSSDTNSSLAAYYSVQSAPRESSSQRSHSL